jgi:hypothetical protein
VSRGLRASRRGRLAVLLFPALGAAPAFCDEGPPPNYVAGFVGTTLAYRPHGGPLEGHQKDLTALLGYGRFVGRSVAVELDLGPTFVEGDYGGFALVPGVVWAFHPNVYAAARFVVAVDPESNVALSPGLGVIRAFGNVSPLLEVNVFSYVGRGDPDLGVSLTAGVLVSF